MNFQDVITYQQGFYKIFKDKEKTKYFYEDKYMQLLKALRLGPMTIDDIIDMYKYEENEKALKTVYRYIKTLQDAELITEAGKRVITDGNNKNKTQTIYCRTAKIFIDYSAVDIDSKDQVLIDKTIDIWTIVLQPLYPGKEVNKEKLRTLLYKIYIESIDFYGEIEQVTSQKFLELTKDYDFIQVSDFFRIMGFFYLLNRYNLQKELTECFE